MASFDPYAKMKDKNQNIQVFVRVRPMNSQEIDKHAIAVLDCPGNREVVVKERTTSNVTKTFTFDKVFGPTSKQVDVYKSVVSPLLEEVLLGYNCTVFAYGQTGTGKTFTMEGSFGKIPSDSTLNWEKDPISGIVPRALSQLFDELRLQNAEFTVRVSLLELYNEELFDLLAPTDDLKLKTLRLYEDGARKGSVIIQGLEEVTVHNKHEVYDIIEKGSLRRQTAATLMNEKSSRSHTVFTVTVHIKESNIDGEELLKIGKLNLVDLAGSENIGRSGAVDKRAREAGSINQSLLTLGRVITALVERAPHVPYRESKLTRLLQDSLGGRTKTSIIATVSPALTGLEETLSTLDYAHRAKNITNRPEINQKLTKKAMLKAYTEEIEQLKKDLLATREKNGVFIDKSNYARMMAQLESQGQDISEKIAQVKSLEDNLEKKDEELTSTKATLVDTQEDLAAANQVIYNLQSKVTHLQRKLQQVKQERDEKDHLVSKQMETESKLSHEAFTLLKTANTTTTNLERLYSKLENKKRVEQGNIETGRRFRKDLTEQLMLSAEAIGKFRVEHARMSGSQRLDLESLLQKKTIERENIQSNLAKMGENLKSNLDLLATLAKDQCMQTTEVGKNIAADLTDHEEKQEEHFSKFLADLTSTIKNVTTQIDSMYDSYNGALANASRHVVSMNEGVNTFTSHLQKDMSISITNIEEYKSEHEGQLSKIISSFSKSKKKTSALQANVRNSFEIVQREFASILLNTQECEKEVDENHNNLCEEAELMKHSVGFFAEKVITQIRRQEETALEHLNWSNIASKDVNDLLQEEKEKNFMPTFRAAKESLFVHENAATEALTESNFLCTSHISKVISHVEEISEKAEATMKHLSQLLEDTKDEMWNILATQQDENLKSFEEDKKMVENIQESIKKECEFASTASEELESQVSQQLAMLSEYFDSTYLIDLPTGVTPPRKVYEYPLALSATSPHDVIINRFRKASKISLPTNLEECLEAAEREPDEPGPGKDDLQL